MHKIIMITLLLLSILQVLCVLVNGDYELQVTFHRFENPNQRCAECYFANGTTIFSGCCDGLVTGDQCSSRQCDMTFSFCQGRALGTPNNDTQCPIRRDAPYFIPNTNGHGFSLYRTVLGLDNPLIFTFNDLQWFGTQFYMEFYDDDQEDSYPDLIDTLAVDIDISIGESINRATYIGRFNNAQVDLSFQVVCTPYYYGPNCESFCYETSCPCDPGFTGEFCEFNIQFDDCAQLNCSGNGQCIDLINDYSNYTCICNAGYTGIDCMTDIDDCEGVDCGNGECIDRVNQYVCNCNLGYRGRHCKTNIDDCAGMTCNDNGECVDGLNSYTCNCDAGFTGKDCEHEINECVNVTCLNGGTCKDIQGLNQMHCICIPGFTGPLCETDIDECKDRDCGPNAIGCTDGVNSFKCICNVGFTGLLCETNIDDCSEVNCGRSRVCVDGVNSYTCGCMPGFTGENCDNEIDECRAMGINCSGRGRCIDQFNNYICICDAGYTGVLCETELTADDQPPNIAAIASGVVISLLLLVVLTLVVIVFAMVCVYKRNKTSNQGDPYNMAPNTAYDPVNQASAEHEYTNAPNKVYEDMMDGPAQQQHNKFDLATNVAYQPVEHGGSTAATSLHGIQEEREYEVVV